MTPRRPRLVPASFSTVRLTAAPRACDRTLPCSRVQAIPPGSVDDPLPDPQPRGLQALRRASVRAPNPEPFGRSIAEAQAVGKPVVGSAVGGIPELIEDGVNGYLFLPGDVDKLAACVVRLLDNPGMAVEFGAAGRQMASVSFTQGRHVEAIQAVYDGL